MIDVAIVGAGAAGVGAARRLAPSGLSVLVIEASDRVGGRAYTLAIDGLALDLGCGWLHSADRNPWVEIAQDGGFTVTRGETAWRRQWRDLGFPPAERAEADAAMEAWHRRLAENPPASDRASDALEPGGRWNAYLQALSGYINAATLESVSIADYQAYDAAATDENWRVREGYGRMIAASLPPVPLRLGTAALGIALERSGVRVDTIGGAIRARAAIVTVSTAVLAAGAIRFDAALDDHLHAAACLPLGLADKVYLALDGGPFEDETHLIGNPLSAETGSYYIRPLGAPVIEGFFGGAGARAHERDGAAAAYARAIDELAALIGSDVRRHLRPLAATAWGRADYIRGSYSHALPGHAAARATLAAPFADRILFAGEATHASDFSTAHGAYQSGVRAADAILEAQQHR